jgi:hypothetical protein
MKKNIALFCIFIANALIGQNSLDVSYLSSGGKLKPLQAIMDIRHYDINLDVDIAKRTIQGNTIVSLNLSKQSDTILLDLVHLLKVSKVLVNKKAVGFEQKDDKIFITSATGFKVGNQLVDIHYGGAPPVAVRPPWLGGFTWAKDSIGNDWVSINIQKEGGRMYFPCKDHPSDEPNEGVDMHITVPKGLVVAGPGLLQKTTIKNNKATYFWKTNYTISNYCVVFNIGKYKVAKDTYTTINGNIVPIEFYVLEEDTIHAKKLIETKKRDTKILEKYFGEYPWYKEKIGIAEVPNSGMEHQTMIAACLAARAAVRSSSARRRSARRASFALSCAARRGRRASDQPPHAPRAVPRTGASNPAATAAAAAAASAAKRCRRFSFFSRRLSSRLWVMKAASAGVGSAAAAAASAGSAPPCASSSSASAAAAGAGAGAGGASPSKPAASARLLCLLPCVLRPMARAARCELSPTRCTTRH